MTVDEVVSKLKSESKEGVKNGWTIIDTCGEETFGLNFSRVQNVAKKMKNDPCLADELYASTNHDLKVLATYIDDARSYSLDELNSRVKQLYLSPFAEKFCHQVMAKSPHAVHFIDSWANCEIGDYRCYAYFTLAEVARQKNNLSDEFYAKQLREIAARFHEEPDTVKQAMQEAILAIGCRHPKLQKQSYKVAMAIGKVNLEDGKAIDAVRQLDKKLNVMKLVKS